MTNVLGYLNLFFVVILFGVSIKKGIFRMPTFLLIFNYLIFDFLTVFTAKAGIKNTFLFNIFDLTDFFFSSVILIGFVKRFKISRGLQKKDALIGVLPSLFVLPLFYFDSIMVLNPYLGFLKCVVLSAILFYYFLKTLKEESISLPAIQDYRIVIPFSMLFINSSGAFIMLFSVYLVNNEKLYFIFWNINTAIYLIYKFLLIFGLWLMRKQP